MNQRPKISIAGYEIIDGVVYYQVSFGIPNKNKILKKRFSQFDQLHKELKEYFDLPVFPEKNLLSLITGKKLEKLQSRKAALDGYLKGLIGKSEIANSQPIRIFLELDEFTHPDNIYTFQGFIHGIRDLAINFEKGMMFVLNSDGSMIGKMDAFFSNRMMREPGTQLIPSGILECWTQEDEEYKKSWVKVYKCQAICLNWNENIILVGLDDGKVNLLKIENNTYVDSLEIEQHTQRVSGIMYYNNQIHSVSYDSRYRILDLKNEQLIFDVIPSGHQLTQIQINEDRQQSYLSDNAGSIFIYHIGQQKHSNIIRLGSDLHTIRGLCFDQIRCYLFAIGYEQGQIGIFDIQKVGFEQHAKELQKINSKSKSREILWSTKRGEIFVGNQDGTVTIWDAKQKSPIYIIQAHTKEITKMLWFEQDQTLITGSKDRTIKAWRLPMRWTTFEEDQTVGIRTKQIDLDEITQWDQKL